MTVVCGGEIFKMPISIQSVKNKLSNPFTFSAGTSKTVHVTKVPGSRLPWDFQVGLRTSMLACNKAYIGEHQAN